MPILIFLSCTIGTQENTFQPQQAHLETIRDHAQKIEVLVQELQQTTQPTQQLKLVQQIQAENTRLQHKTESFKASLKVSPKPSPMPEPP